MYKVLNKPEEVITKIEKDFEIKLNEELKDAIKNFDTATDSIRVLAYDICKANNLKPKDFKQKVQNVLKEALINQQVKSV